MFMTSTIDEAITITLSKGLHSVNVSLIHGHAIDSFFEACYFSSISND